MMNQKIIQLHYFILVILGLGIWSSSSICKAWINTDVPTEQVKLYLDEDGIYHISGLDLIDSGVNLSKINPQTFRLINRGKEIPIYLNAESETGFGSNNIVEFYGEKNRNSDGGQNEYSDTNIYYLSWGESTGLRC